MCSLLISVTKAAEICVLGVLCFVTSPPPAAVWNALDLWSDLGKAIACYITQFSSGEAMRETSASVE